MLWLMAKLRPHLMTFPSASAGIYILWKNVDMVYLLNISMLMLSLSVGEHTDSFI